MRLEKRIGGILFGIEAHRFVKVRGISSKLSDNEHVLMWDFDNQTVDQVLGTLRAVQEHWHLSDVYVVQSGDDRHYHAYCFTVCDFQGALMVLMNTPNIDQGFLRIGVIRGFWDLRITPKDGKPFRSVATLRSSIPPDVAPTALRNQVDYWTKPRKRDKAHGKR